MMTNIKNSIGLHLANLTFVNNWCFFKYLIKTFSIISICLPTMIMDILLHIFVECMAKI